MAQNKDDKRDDAERPWVLGWVLSAIVIILLATLVFGW